MMPDYAIRLFAQRIETGDRVSEDDLFGIIGHRAVKDGLASAEVLAEWRRHALAVRVAFYGEAATEAWVADRRERLRALLRDVEDQPRRDDATRNAMPAAAAMVRRMEST